MKIKISEPLKEDITKDSDINDNELFFIHGITPIIRNTELENNEFIVDLIKINNTDNNENSQLPDLESHEVSNNIVKNFYEGQFVYRVFGKNNNIILMKAGNDKLAQRHIIFNNKIRSLLIKAAREQPVFSRFSKDAIVKSYHVNVGHGNCSFIVINDRNAVRIWAVDCSEWDFRNRTSYRDNIKSCLKYIEKKYKLNKIEIEKFFLTHSHYDHYNGLPFLLNMYSAKGAEVWINPYYSYSSPTYNNFLKLLNNRFKTKSIKIIDSYPRNNNLNISILNKPDLIVRTKPTGMTGISSVVGTKVITRTSNILIQSKINNSSIVYRFSFGDKSILFPGDIENEGWKHITSCMPYLKNSTYYCLSHHGSMNGHIRTYCPAGKKILDITSCTKNIKLGIFLGRDGAFPGILNPKVKTDFTTNGIKVYQTDKNDSGGTYHKFFELDWSNDNITYI